MKPFALRRVLVLCFAVLCLLLVAAPAFASTITVKLNPDGKSPVALRLPARVTVAGVGVVKKWTPQTWSVPGVGPQLGGAKSIPKKFVVSNTVPANYTVTVVWSAAYGIKGRTDAPKTVSIGWWWFQQDPSVAFTSP